jgi:hypothetical protein
MAFVIAFLFLAACARLEPLTFEALQAAEQRWRSFNPGLYRLVVEMEGDRIEPGRFEIRVAGDGVSIRRNGEVIVPQRPEDYSMDGWFRMLRQELDLAGNAQLLGAPEGYSSYPMARFDEQTGRLVRFQRSVGGTQNSISIDIVEFEVEGQPSRP